MFRSLIQSIKWTFFLCHTTSCPTAGKFTNMLWLLSTSPAATKKLSLWPQKTLPKLPRLLKQFPGAALWLGHRCCRLTLAASSWKAWPKRWKTSKHTFVAAHWTSPRPSYCGVFQPHTHRAFAWISICRGNAPAFGPAVDGMGQKVPWCCCHSEQWSHLPEWQKKPVVAIEDKAISGEPSTPYSRPVGVNEKQLLSDVNVSCLYQPGELEGGGKRATDPIWSLKFTHLKELWPIRTSLFFTICMMGWSVALSARSCWLSRQIHSCHLLGPCETRLAQWKFRQHPSFVVISAQPQLLCLYVPILSLTIRNTLFSTLSVLPLSAALKCYHAGDVVLSLWHALNAELFFFTVMFINIVALWT